MAKPDKSQKKELANTAPPDTKAAEFSLKATLRDKGIEFFIVGVLFTGLLYSATEAYKLSVDKDDLKRSIQQLDNTVKENANQSNKALSDLTEKSNKALKEYTEKTNGDLEHLRKALIDVLIDMGVPAMKIKGLFVAAGMDAPTDEYLLQRLVQQASSPNSARDILRSALEMDGPWHIYPEGAAVLAESFIKSGDYEKAISMLEEAAKRAPNDQHIRDKLSEARQAASEQERGKLSNRDKDHSTEHPKASR